MSSWTRSAHISSVHKQLCQHQGKSPFHSSHDHFELLHSRGSSLLECSPYLMPNQDKCNQNGSETLQPMGRNLAPSRPHNWSSSGLETKTPGLTVALSLLFFPSPLGALSSWAPFLVNFVIWRNRLLWACFLTCKQDNGIYLRGCDGKGENRLWI